MEYTIQDYKIMVGFSRKEGSQGQKDFCRAWLEPVFGIPDEFGNYILTIGERPDIAFMAHHDTVHRSNGYYAEPFEDQGFVSSGFKTDVLGADCTTGIWLILNMIAAKIPGVYIIHAGEEIGCVGSKALVKNNVLLVDDLNFAISFDRMGYDSIITHQIGMRTCSDKFAEQLANLLGSNFKPDPTGVYTDSNEYSDYVSECTNVSVGYFHQHTVDEYQDLVFMESLCEALLEADWSTLKSYRNPLDQDYGYWPTKVKKVRESAYTVCSGIQDVVEMYPNLVAMLLERQGYDSTGLSIDLEEIEYENTYLWRGQ